MKKTKLTEAEIQLVLRERARLALDTLDWSTQATVTDQELKIMSAHAGERLTAEWIYDPPCHVWRNPKHPRNVEFMLRIKVEEAWRVRCAERQ